MLISEAHSHQMQSPTSVGMLKYNQLQLANGLHSQISISTSTS